MSSWYLRSLAVWRFEGIGLHAEPVQLAALSPGINLIWAPNRRGKSCTARAILAAMRGDRQQAMRSIVNLDYVDGGEHGAYEFNGQTAPLAMPDGFANVANRYQLALHDLLVADDAGIAHALLEELYGGVNVDGLARALDFGESVKGTRKAAQAYRTLKGQLGAARREHLELVRQAEQLANMRAKLLGLHEALGEGVWLQLVREYRQAEETLRLAELVVEAFGEADAACLARLSRDGCALLDTHLANRGRWLAAVREAGERTQAAEDALAANPFGRDTLLPDEAILETLAERLQELRDCEVSLGHQEDAVRDQQQICRRLQGAAEAAAEAVEAFQGTREFWPDAAGLQRAEDACGTAARAAERLGEADAAVAAAQREGEALSARLAQILPAAGVERWLAAGGVLPSVTEVSAKARQRETLSAAAVVAAEEAEAAASAAAALADAGDTAERTVPLLEAWLDDYQATGATPQSSSGLRWLVWGSIAGLAVAIVILALAVNPLFWLGLVLIPILLVADWRMAGGSGDAASAANAPVKLPAGVAVGEWRFANVREVLAEQSGKRDEWRRLQRSRDQAKAVADDRQRQLTGAEKELDQAVTAFAAAFGEGSEALEASQIDGVMTDLSALREAARKTAEETAKQEVRAGRLAAALAEVATCLSVDGFASAAAAQEAVTRAKLATAKREELQREHTEATQKAVDAAAREEDLTKALGEVSARRQELATTLIAALREWCGELPGAADATNLGQVVKQLRASVEACRQVRSELAAAVAEAEKAQRELAAEERAVSGWFESAGFAAEAAPWEHSLTALARLRPQIDAFLEARRALADASRDAAAAERKLVEEAVPEDLRSLTLAAITVREAELPARREAAAELQASITRLEQSIERLSAGGDVESLSAASEDALDVVRQLRDQAVLNEAGSKILSYLKQRFLSRNSTTLDEASRRLSEFSGFAYELSLDTSAEPRLAATCVRSGSRQNQPLGELSSNTRIQALMAARLAFLRTREAQWGGLRLPLIVDEALAIADPEGADSVMRTLTAEAAEGRQILYFTAQPNEIQQWQDYLRGLDAGPEWRLLDGMGDCRELLAEAGSTWQPQGLPKPESDESLPAYAMRLGVAPLNPWAPDPVAAAHPYYVVDDDPAQLRQLVSRCRSCGELSSWLAYLGDDLGVVATAFGGDASALTKRWQGRLRLLGKAIELWRQGRTAPLTRDELVTENFLTENQADRASDLLAAVAGDPVAFAAELPSVSGLGKTTRDKLLASLEEAGRLPVGETLDQDGAARSLRRRYPDDEAEIERVLGRLSHLWD